MKKLLVYFSIALCFGCISGLMWYSNIILGAVISASFLAIVIFTMDKYFILQIVIFYFLGIICVYNYFNIDINGTLNQKIRIVEKNEYYTLGNYKNRKILLLGNTKEMYEGENIIIQGEFSKEKNISSGIVGSCNVNKTVTVKSDFISEIYKIRRNLFKDFSESLGKERAAMVMAICFGDRKDLSVDQKNDFQSMGVMYAISVSGFHLAVVYSAFEKIFGIIPGLVLSFLYMIFTGNHPATVRAFLMILLVRVSKKIYKNYDSFSAIALSAMIILIIKPYYIIDIGFGLSYLSTISILLFNKRIKRKLIFLPTKLSESISVSLSAQILTMPYVIFSINNISIGFLLGNIFLFPMYTLVIILGNFALLTLKFKFIFNLVCIILNVVSTAIEGATVLVMEICPPLRYCTFEEGWMYVFLFVAILLYRRGIKEAKFIPLVVFMAYSIQGYCFFPKISFLNSGKSDSLLIRYKTSCFLITDDGGSKTLDHYKKEFRTTKIISAKDGNNKFLIGKDYEILVNRPVIYKDKLKSMVVKVISKDKTIMITRKKELATLSMNNKKNCDIIVLPEDEKIPPLDFNVENIYSYNIIFGTGVRD